MPQRSRSVSRQTLEQAAWFERDRPDIGHVEQADDVAVLDDRFPTEQVLHAFEQRTDAAAALIRDRVVALDGKHELLVLGTEAEPRSGLAARFKPRDEFLARFDRRHVDLVASHTPVPTERAATLHGACKGGQLLSGLVIGAWSGQISASAEDRAHARIRRACRLQAAARRPANRP